MVVFSINFQLCSHAHPKNICFSSLLESVYKLSLSHSVYKACPSTRLHCWCRFVDGPPCKHFSTMVEVWLLTRWQFWCFDLFSLFHTWLRVLKSFALPPLWIIAKNRIHMQFVTCMFGFILLSFLIYFVSYMKLRLKVVSYNQGFASCNVFKLTSLLSVFILSEVWRSLFAILYMKAESAQLCLFGWSSLFVRSYHRCGSKAFLFPVVVLAELCSFVEKKNTGYWI